MDNFRVLAVPHGPLLDLAFLASAKRDERVIVKKQN
jgi:hypothetical protein